MAAGPGEVRLANSVDTGLSIQPAAGFDFSEDSDRNLSLVTQEANRLLYCSCVTRQPDNTLDRQPAIQMYKPKSGIAGGWGCQKHFMSLLLQCPEAESQAELN